MTPHPGRSAAMVRFGPDEIRRGVDRATALESARRAFEALATGRAVAPRPLGLELPEVQGEVHVKGAWIRGAPVLAVKVASGFYRNPERGLPTGSGLMLVLDADTGVPLGLLEDGGYLTELRTAAAGALAAKHLTSDPLRRVALVGAGTQARFQLRALVEVRRVESVVAWSPHPEHTRRYAAEMDEALGLAVSTASTPEQAVRGADLVVTVTPSRAPLVRAEWLDGAATVVAVGSDGPGKQELAAEVLVRADKLIVDEPDQCARLGELQHALAAGLLGRDDIHGTLGEVVTGRCAGREGSELIVCDLTGVGVQDAAIAELAWRALGGRSRPGG